MALFTLPDTKEKEKENVYKNMFLLNTCTINEPCRKIYLVKWDVMLHTYIALPIAHQII
jgi:hypothetical protein